MKYIITADDYGISPIIDDAIQDAVAKGCVTSVAGFANGLDNNRKFSVQKLKNLKGAFPNIKVGMHFTLTSGRAVSGKPQSLIRNWSNHFKFMIFQNPNEMDMGELKQELNSQIEVFERANLEIDHFSDHVGILTLSPETMDVYIEVVKSYCNKKGREIPVRNPLLTAALIRNGCLNDSKMYSKGRMGGRIMPGVTITAQTMKERLSQLQRSGLKTTDYFIEHLYQNPKRSTLTCIFNETPDIRNNLVTKRVLNDPVSEIVTHLSVRPSNYRDNPGYNDEIRKLKNHKGISIRYLKFARHEEYRMLTNELPTMFSSIDLITFP